MRENHQETPMNLRRSKSISDQSKKSHKTRKNLIEVSGEVSVIDSSKDLIDLQKDLIELSSISEEDKMLISSSDLQPETPSSEKLSVSDLSSSSSSIKTPSSEKHSVSALSSTETPSSEKHSVSALSSSSSSITHCGIEESKLVKSTTSVESETVAKHLRDSMVQLLKSNDIDSHSKKLLETLVEFTLKEFHGVSDEKDRVTQLIEKKYLVMLICLFLWSLVVFAVLLTYFHGQRKSLGSHYT